MRVYLSLLIVSFCGVFLPHQASGACPGGATEEVVLKYNQLGQSWFVNADNHVHADEALKGSPTGRFIFGTSAVDEYYIEFTHPVRVESLAYQIRLSDTTTVRAFQTGATLPAYDVTKTTGGNSYQLNGDPFDIMANNVVGINITWTTTETEVGIKQMAITVCEIACTDDVHVVTNGQLTLPAGFSMDVMGPPLIASGSFSDQPIAVFKGSRSKIKMRNTMVGENFININSTTAFNVRTIDMKTRHGDGMIVTAYADIDKDELLFVGGVGTDDTTWTDLQVHALIGPIVGVKRLDIEVLYDQTLSDQLVNCKKLHFFTCQ